MSIPSERTLLLLYIHVETSLFVAGGNAIEKSLLMIASVFVTSEQAANNSGALDHVVVAQNVRHPRTQFLYFSYH